MFTRFYMFLIIFLSSITGCLFAGESSTSDTFELSNTAYRLTVVDCKTGIRVCLFDNAVNMKWCDAPYLYRISRKEKLGTMNYENLESLSITRERDAIRIHGVLGDIELDHKFELPSDKPIMEERIVLRNSSGSQIIVNEMEMGFQKLMANEVGKIIPDFSKDRIVAIPFRRRAIDPSGYINDFSMSDIVNTAGNELRHSDLVYYGKLPSRHHVSEGWAWTHGSHTLGIFKFNQENMEFSVISTQNLPEGVSLRFGGTCMINGEPSVLGRIAAGQTVDLGVMRYQTLKGDYNDALYAFRDMLDEKGCRFPANYNPPVHWNELYDDPEWSGVSTPGNPEMARASVRAYSYTKTLIEKEAAKARDYNCEALYLDPGWDTRFGSFIWGEQWLGPQKEFVRELKSKFGLELSLHCPLASWMSHPVFTADRNSFNDWPKESARMSAEGKIIEGSVCLGSQQYLQMAEQRLLKCCADGATFLMYDGNAWNDGCWNTNHGHPVPYRFEDHIRASLYLAQRVHAVYPNVIIEMHDMLAGGSRNRMTPVYYKYGLPGSYDDNWGFELMWEPFVDLKEGRGRALYYYNMACNVPVYLHIDLRNDNEHCFVLWWFASTCRHLGIGGTHPNPLIAENQKAAMRHYHSLERFYKRGNFYGINEEIHVHVLPEENAFVVNVFNLSDETRVIKGSIPVERLGIDVNRWYMRYGRIGSFDDKSGVFSVYCELEPWSTELTEFRGVEPAGRQ